MRNDQPARMDCLLQVRAPEALANALDRAANRQLQSRSDFIRCALIDRLKAEGLAPAFAVAS